MQQAVSRDVVVGLKQGLHARPADMLAREATERAEVAERKFLRLSTVLDTFLQNRDPHLHARVWAKFQESMGD